MINHRRIRTVLLALGLISSDQLIKYFIRQSDGFYICNYGIAFGIKISEIFFWTLIAIIFFGMFYFLKNKNNFLIIKNFRYEIILIISGAVSNIIDRITLGCVVDFIDIKIINYPVFNLADSFIFVGTALIFWKILKLKI